MVVDLQSLPDVMNEKYLTLIKASERYLLLYGGGGSGKSVGIAQLIVIRMLIESGHRFLVLRKVHRTLKRSVFQLLRDVISEWRLDGLFSFNMTDMTITCKNESQILFSGLDDVEKLKSITGITSVWIEEATEITQADFEQVNLRLRGQTPHRKQIYITFNPISAKHWLKGRFFDKDSEDVKIVHSTYRDNRFIDEEYMRVLEGLIDTDKRLYDVYTLGKWGVLEGLIYDRYDTIQELPEEYEYRRYGLDFGYKNAMALIEVRIIGQNAYIRELFYQTEKTTDDLIGFMKSEGISIRDQIRADAAEPDRIEQICRKGFNAVAAKKNVLSGIDAVKSYTLHITDDSINLLREMDSYRWAQDRNGTMLDQPTKIDDHAMDALRYAIFTDEVHGSKVHIGQPRYRSKIAFGGFDEGPRIGYSKQGRFKGY